MQRTLCVPGPRWARVLCSSLLCVAASVMPAQAADLTKLLQEVSADPAIPATAIVLIKNGQIVQQLQQGVLAAGEQPARPVSAADVWHIGSNGKAMTATLMARLVELGKLRWNDTLASLLPELAPRMHPAYRQLTIIDLLSHRAGLAANADEAWLESTYTDKTDVMALRQLYAAKVLTQAPIAPARQQANYSNSGTILCGAIAERLSGKPFEQLITELVFAPLGMQVGFGPTPASANTGHKDGKPIRGEHASNPKVMIPAGDMYMTMQDWAAFAIDQMLGEQGRGKLLQQASYQHLHQVQGDSGAASGWGVRTDFPQQRPVRLLMHAGSNGYWQAVVTLQPDTQKALLIASNAGEGTQAEAYQMQIAMTVFSE